MKSRHAKQILPLALATMILNVGAVSPALANSATVPSGQRLAFDKGPVSTITNINAIDQSGDFKGQYFVSAQPKFKVGDQVTIAVNNSQNCSAFNDAGKDEVTFIGTQNGAWYFETTDRTQTPQHNGATGLLGCTGTASVVQVAGSDDVAIGVNIAPGEESSRHYYDVITINGRQIDAVVTYVAEQDIAFDDRVNGQGSFEADLLEYLDDEDDTDSLSSPDENDWLNTSLDFETGLGDSWAEFRVDFYTDLATNPVRVSLDDFRVTVYDIDSNQYFEATEFSRYQLDAATELVVSTSGNRTRFFEPDLKGNDQYDTELGINNSNRTLLRVTLQFDNPIQTFTYRLGKVSAQADTGGASYEIDFSAGWNENNAWTDSIRVIDNPAPTSFNSVSVPSKPYEGPINLAHISNTIESGTDAIVTGQRLNTVAAVHVGDKLVPHKLLSDGRLSYSLIGIPAGSYVTKFWVPVNSINLTDQIRVTAGTSPPSATTPGAFTANRLFANYRGDRGPITPRDLRAITSFIRQHPGITDVRCVGSTSGVPAKSTDPALATARAKNACDAIQRLVPGVKVTLETSTGKGIGQRFRSVHVYISGTR